MVVSTAGDRFNLNARRLESHSVRVGRQVSEDWAPRHGSLATPGLICLVQSEDAEVRNVGVWALATLPFKQADARVVAVIKALSSDPDLDVRRAAVESAQFTAAPGDEHVLAALSDRLLVDEDFSVRRAAAEGIRKLVLDRHTHLGNACRILAPHLPGVFDIILRCWAPRRRDGHAVEEVKTKEKMRFSGDELVASVRTAGVGISQEETRGIFALARPTVDKLLSCSEVERAVSETASKERLPEFVLEALARALMDASTSVRSEALRAIEHVTERGDARATSLLVEYVEKGLGVVRCEVLQALTSTARAGDACVTVALTCATEDPRPNVRRLALALLTQHVDLSDPMSRQLVQHAAAARSMREETDTAVRAAALRLLSALQQPSAAAAPVAAAAVRGGGGGAHGEGGGRGVWIAASRRETIEERLGSAEAQERYMACREVELLAHAANDSPDRQRLWLERVVQLLRVDEDARVRAAAMSASARLVSRALKDADARGLHLAADTRPYPHTRIGEQPPVGRAEELEEIKDMVVKVLLERVRKEEVETTRLQAVKMLRTLAKRSDRLVLSVLLSRVAQDPSLQMRKCIMLAIGELMGSSDEGAGLGWEGGGAEGEGGGERSASAAAEEDGGVAASVGLFEELGLYDILVERSNAVSESVETRKLAKALLHRLDMLKRVPTS